MKVFSGIGDKSKKVGFMNFFTHFGVIYVIYSGRSLIRCKVLLERELYSRRHDRNMSPKRIDHKQKTY